MQRDAQDPIETCSPVEAITSSSRGLGRIDLLREREQPVGLPRHGRRGHHQLVALAGEARHALRDLANALGAAHRGAAVLLDDQ